MGYERFANRSYYAHVYMSMRVCSLRRISRLTYVYAYRDRRARLSGNIVTK